MGYDSHLSSLDISSVETKHLEQLNIRGYPNVEDIIVDNDWAGGRAYNNPQNSMMRIQSCFLGLQYIMVQDCVNLKDLTQLCFVPNLLSVDVRRCSRMETIINLSKLVGDANVAKEFNLFAKLMYLHFEQLPALESVYKTALPFPCLKWFHVYHCPALKKLPLNSSTAQGDGCNFILRGKQKWWDGLEWEDQLALDTIRPCYMRWE